MQDFANNLIESGVHGGLIALDEGFDANALALALKIPTQNTQVTDPLQSLFISSVYLLENFPRDLAFQYQLPQTDRRLENLNSKKPKSRHFLKSNYWKMCSGLKFPVATKSFTPTTYFRPANCWNPNTSRWSGPALTEAAAGVAATRSSTTGAAPENS